MKVLYIVTKNVGSDVIFKNFADLRSRVKIETVVQIRLIERLLRLTDISTNLANWGQKQTADGQFAPVIIDFK
jgi:hypothetical protein